MSDIERFFLRRNNSLADALRTIEITAKGIALVVDEAGRLEATVTDGDLRRAILQGVKLEAPLADVLAIKVARGMSPPQTASRDASPDELRARMREASVRQLPLLDAGGTVVALAVREDLEPAPPLPLQAVIMAGGSGSRLRPLTNDTPKPLLSIAGRPLIERTIAQLREAGVQRINVTTHYLADKIASHLGDGENLGVQLNVVAEDQPLGTAGALRMLAATEEPLLVMNGDILTSVDFRQLVEFHREQRASLTVGARQYSIEIPFGVIEVEGARVRGLREKPKYDFLVNGGIYLLEPSVRKLIPADRPYHMTDLITRLLQDGQTVATFPIIEYWLDIGHHDDFEKAQQDVPQMRWAA